MLLQILLVWITVSAVLFGALAVITPDRDLNRASPQWMAALAFLWPLLVLYFLIGWLVALFEVLLGKRPP